MRGARSSVRVAIGGVGLALTLAACSAATGEADSTSESPAQETTADASDTPSDASGAEESPDSSGSSSQDDAESPAQDGSASPSAPSQDLENLGERPSVEHEDAVVVLNSVTVKDEIMTEQFSLQNNSDVDDIQVSDCFSNGVVDATSDEYRSVDDGSVDGVFVTTGEQNRYFVGRGENGVCACTSDLHSNFVQPGQSEVFSAVFAAPPQDVSSVDVHIPTAGAFTDIPVQR